MRRRRRKRRKRKRRRRRRTSVNPTVINDVGVNPPSDILLHMPLQRIISNEGAAPFQDNRLKTGKHAKTLFSGFQRHGSTYLLR
eukprot:3627520-Pyramimonas_sp.AAC.1